MFADLHQARLGPHHNKKPRHSLFLLTVTTDQTLSQRTNSWEVCT